MPSPQPDDIRWTPQARDALTAHTKELHSSLRKIAAGLAQGGHSERVIEKHITDAFEILSAEGLRRRWFFQRREFEVGLGSLLFGGAGSLPDIVNGIFPHANHAFDDLISGAMIASMLIGLGLILHGWLRNHGGF